MSEIVKYTLSNGLTVLLQPLEHAVSVSSGLWVKTGSRHELTSQYGYAHFVEHMLFKGTSQCTAREIAQVVDRVGGQHNAATNREYTCYYINVVADSVDLSLRVLADMYYNSLFAQEDIDKEIDVVVEEMRMYEDTPDEHIHDMFMEAMFAEHPLGHSILGTYDSITRLNKDSILAFYNDHYTTRDSILVVAGKFDVAQVKDSITRYYNQQRGNEVCGAGKILHEGSPKRIFDHHIPRDLEQVHFCLGWEGISKKNDDRWIMYLVSTILGGSMSSRLFQKIREQEGLCYSVYSFHSSYTDLGTFGIYCGTSPDKYQKAKAVILRECKKLLERNVTEEELQDAKTFMKGNLALSLENIEVKMGNIARNEIMYGNHLTFEDISASIDAVRMNDFYRLVDKIFKNQRCTLVSIGNLKKNTEKELYVC